ncbi:ferric reductase like transmembrane component domain-containing protein [Sarocladium implicatum]|nr:ferric reductase like transmembrane component domain-containing protein [Sarocladium implicatum]
MESSTLTQLLDPRAHPDAVAAAAIPTGTIEPYTTALNGVNQPMNMFLKRVLWWTLGILALFILTVRICELIFSKMRLINAMSQPRNKQRYWRNAQWSWMPWLKKYIIYAPLWKKRHNREIRLSSVIHIGTLPSRLHFIILFVWLVSNFVYMFLLNWANENRYAFCAELRGRSGTLALVNMVPLIMFAGRNNPLIGLLQISFDTYNLLHRWMGRIVVLEVVIHVVAWAIPMVAALGWEGVRHKIMTDIFIGSGTIGTVAMVIIAIWSLSPVRHAFYETFLNAHIILAIVALVSTYLHCVTSKHPGGLPQWSWVVAIAAMWFADRLARVIRMMYANWSSKGVTTAYCEAMPGEATRVTMTLPKYLDVKPGTHAYIRFWGVNPWESHPFSIAWVEHDAEESLPLHEKNPLASLERAGKTSVSFIIGAQTGMTRKLFNKANVRGTMTVKAAFEGPYAGHHSLDSYGHVVLFAGASGITHQMSYIRHLLDGYNEGIVATRRITLVWIIRTHDALEWVRPYMDAILRIPYRKDVLRIQVYITRPRNARDVTSASSTVSMFPGRPNIPLILAKEVQDQVGAMCVTVCGPGALADDVRGAARAVQGESSVSFIEEAFCW